jgi:nicotinic acid mononucleotide adenylyltransferase
MRPVLAVYPGSFDPPTVAHLAIAEAALAHVDEVRFVLSQTALGKEDLDARTPVALRRDVLERATAAVPGLSVVVTNARLVVDIVEEAGADAVVVGADKWSQMLDPAWYGDSVAARDAAVARLPQVLLAARAGRGVAAHPSVVLLDVDAVYRHVSSTRARTGDGHLMLPEAHGSGHWS